LRKKSCQKTWPQFPEPVQNIQVNCCKFTTCESFGITPESALSTKEYINTNINSGQDQPSKHHPLYSTSGTGRGEAALVCKSCTSRKEAGEVTSVSYMLKSNLAVVEEYERLSAYLSPCLLRCPNPNCEANASENVQQSIKKRGLTAAGKQRYQCLLCNTSFSNSDGSRKQRRQEINIRIFDLLISKTPLRKIAKILNISTRTIYLKIDFLHKQCMRFAADRERRLMNGKLKLDRLYLATDRQIQITNWTRRDDKRNTELYGISTACLNTGYVFGFHFNFDGTVTQEEAEVAAQQFEDQAKPKHHRQTARLWLEQDFNDSVSRNRKGYTPPASSIEGIIEQKVQSDLAYNESLSSEDFDTTTRLPAKGVLIHNEYTMLGHFLVLKKLFSHVGKTRFYLDQDAGMRNAYLSIFKDEIKEQNSDGFIVQTEKGQTVEEKRRTVRDTNRMIFALTGIPRRQLSSSQFKDVVNELIIGNLNNLLTIRNSPDRWLRYPIATLAEPVKMVAAITDISKCNPEHQANLYRKASLHAVDRFFMISRRDVNLLERPFASATNNSRIWNGYSAYDPTVLTKLADIYRVYFNYVNENNKRETPAMRLGLAKGPVSTEKIIYFDKYS